MKFTSTILSFILAINFCFSQIDCKPYVPVDKGTKWEITNYSKKGKKTGRITYELVDKIEKGKTIIFTIKNKTFDNKNKEIFTNKFDAKCINGKFEFDMAFKMDGSALQNYQNMDVEVDASKFEIPSIDTNIGSKVDDGTLEIGVGSGGTQIFKMKIFITDRIVENKESITTPAGTFNCLVFTQNVQTKMVININGKSKEWYAENIGLVRSESYNKNGKLMGYSELTKLEQ